MDYAVLSRFRPELMGIAMLWVMLFHAADLSFGVPILDLVRAAGFGGVDIFVLLSAMGLSMSLDRREQPYEDFMRRRAGRILPAYYLVMIPYTLWCVKRGTAALSALVWNSALLSYWVNCKGKFNWYVTGIMLFYGLTPWCFRRLKASRHREGLVCAAAVLSMAVCQILIQDAYWNHLDILYRVPVFLMGLLLGLYIRQGRRLSWKGTLFWGCSLLLGIVYLAAWWNHWSTWIYLPACHLFVFTTVPMCLIFCWLFAHSSLAWLKKALRFVGESSLEIYLLNVSFFSEIELLRRWMPFLNSNSGWFVLIVLNIVLGVLLRRLVERLTRGKGNPKNGRNHDGENQALNGAL